MYRWCWGASAWSIFNLVLISTVYTAIITLRRYPDRPIKEGHDTMAKTVTETVDKVETPNKDEKTARLRAVDLAVSQIEKQFGAGSIMKLGEAHKIDVKTIPSGSLSLDLALGGGIPEGRIIEIYGPESSGKTTLALHTVADPTMGMQARLMSQALRKLTGVISKSRTTVIFINQLRMKIGVMFGNPETTAGGNALKYYASLRLDIRRTEQIKDGDKVIGNRVKVKVVKNKVAPPFRLAEFDIMYNRGISVEGDLLDLAVKYELVKKSGAWYEYKDEKMGQGREAAKAFLEEHKAAVKELDQAVRKAAEAG
jgi:RecA/RadA recombinase